MSSLEGFDGSKIIDQRAKRHVTAAYNMLEQKMQAQIARLEELNRQAEADREQAARDREAAAEALQAVEKALVTFQSEGEMGDSEAADFDLGDYTPASGPGYEALAVRLDNLDSRMLEMAGRLNSVQEEARAPAAPAPQPGPSGGFSPFVTHEKMQRALEDMDAAFSDKVLQWAYDNSHILIEVTQPRGVHNGPSGPVSTRDDELEDSLLF